MRTPLSLSYNRVGFGERWSALTFVRSNCQLDCFYFSSNPGDVKLLSSNLHCLHLLLIRLLDGNLDAIAAALARRQHSLKTRVLGKAVLKPPSHPSVL